MFKDKKLLITGGTGSFGNAVLKRFLDSDISVVPETLTDFFQIIEEGKADLVNGTRFVYKMEKGAMRKFNNFGNLFFQFIISIVINKKLTDSLCGTKVFKKNSIQHLHSWSNNLKVKDPFGDFDFILRVLSKKNFLFV